MTKEQEQQLIKWLNENKASAENDWDKAESEGNNPKLYKAMGKQRVCHDILAILYKFEKEITKELD